MQLSKLSRTDALLVKNGSHLTVMQFSNLSCKTHTPGTVVLGGETARQLLLNSNLRQCRQSRNSRRFRNSYEAKLQLLQICCAR